MRTSTFGLQLLNSTFGLRPGECSRVAYASHIGHNGCCPPLNQTLSPSTAFADGVLTFVYDSNLCRTLVTANCSQPNPTLELNAAIVVNTNNFLVVGPRNVTFAGVCGANRSWQMGNPPLAVQNIECLLTNPTGG
ncbi:hypothetical protein GPALN_005138 [Globodera pallida]|nr:hypothetical protein GPALN_005138 [Globodera pallida]